MGFKFIGVSGGAASDGRFRRVMTINYCLVGWMISILGDSDEYALDSPIDRPLHIILHPVLT